MQFEAPFTSFNPHAEVITLGSLCQEGGGNIQTGPFGSQLHSEDYVQVGVPSIMPKNISVEGVTIEDIAYISNQDAMRLTRYLVATGDIVYSRRGDIEKCALITERENGWLCGTGCLRIRLGRNARITAEYLHAYLSHPAVTGWLVRRAIGATMPNLNTGILSSLPVFIHEEKQTQRIGALWSSINHKINLNQQMNATLEELARTIFQSWFVNFDPVRAKVEAKMKGCDPERAAMSALGGKTDTELNALTGETFASLAATAALFPDSFTASQAGEVPAGWTVEPLDRVADFLNGLALQKYPPNEGGSLAVIKIAQLKKGGVEGADHASAQIPANFIVNDGDVLFSWSGSLEVDVWCGGRGALNQHLFKVTSERFPKWFYYHWTRQHLSHFKAIASGKAVTMGHIQRHHLTQALCVVPPSNLLARVTAIMQPLLDMQVANRLQNRQLQLIRDTLLPKLISGEVLAAEGVVESVNV